jgi:ribosomal protein S18 acetylase RimI-like enzyme
MTLLEPNGCAVRSARAEEADMVVELWRQSGATVSVTDTPEDVRRALAFPCARILVAEAAGQLVGSILGTFDGWRGNIYRLVVRPEFRRRGLARRLVAEVETWLVQQGARRVTALVEKDHGWATGFWEAVGYAVDRRMVRYARNL